MFLTGVYFYIIQVKISIKLFTLAVSLSKPSLGNVFPEVFLNLRKSLSEPLLNTIGLRTSVKYHGLKTSIKYLGLKTSVKYHEF